MVEELNDFQIYPNPAKNRFTIEAGAESIEQIRVLDLSGKLVYNGLNSNMESKLFVNSANWESGVYFIQIYTESEIFHQKVVVTR